VRYLRVGGRGQGLGAGKTRSEENAAESHTARPEPVEGSDARCVGTLLICKTQPPIF